jgi:hypothetical protein
LRAGRRLRRLEASRRLFSSSQAAPLNAEYLVDAATTSFVASIGIAAAVVRRHWFLRFAAVGGVLALGLLVPAYEIVIEFAIQVAVISAGVALWRGASIRRPRMALETALLAMVVAAVMAAVVGAAPTFGWDTWTRIVFLGFTLGAMSLLSLWIACGRASLRTRLVFGALGVVVFIAIFHLGIALRDAYYSSQRGNDWWSYLVNCYRPEFLAGWLKQVVPGIVLGVVTFTTLLMLARGSGWFTEGDATDVLAPWKLFVRTISRVCLCAGFGIIATVNVYLLYRLCTPPPRLPEQIPADNGYDDFLAAGTWPGIDYMTMRSQHARDWSDADLARLLSELQPAFASFDAGLKKPSWVTSAYADASQSSDEQLALLNLGAAIDIQLEDLQRRGKWREYVDRCCEGLRFAHECSRGQRWSFALDDYLAFKFAEKLEPAIGALTGDECLRLSARLLQIEQAREPVTLKMGRERIFWKRRSWQDHLQRLVLEWNGNDADPVGKSALERPRNAQALVHLRAVQAALQAYWLDHHATPQDIEALTPNYLPMIPADPWRTGPLQFSSQDGAYTVYSVGKDGQHGGSDPLANIVRGIDLVVTGPRLPPVPYRWKRAAAEYGARAWAMLKATSAAAAAQQELRPPSDAR